MTTRLLFLLLFIPTLAFGQIRYHRTNGFVWTGGPMYGDGSGLTNLPTSSGTGSSNITDNAYYAVARNVRVNTNAEINNLTVTNLTVDSGSGIGYLSLENSGTNIITLNGTNGTVTSVTNVSQYYVGNGAGLTNLPGGAGEILSAKSIMNYGAVADGNTDCSIAFSNANYAAKAANTWVYIPSGTYLITNLTANCTGWFGDGTNSILKFAAGTNGAAITSSGCSLRDFSVWGQSTIYYGVSTNTQGTRIGVLHDPSGETEVARLNIWGFDKAALEVAGTATVNRELFTKFHGNWLHDSYTGFTNRPGTAEYCEVNNNRIWKCYNSLSANAANMKISQNIITDGYNGGYWGTASDLRGHSSWVNNTFNHLGGGAFTVVSNNTGGTFIGNSIFSAQGFKIYNSKGLTITGNQFQGVELQVDTGANHLSKSILFYGNQYIVSDGGLVDYSGQLFHWGNYNATTGVMVDGTGAPYYTAGGFGFVEGPLFAVRGSAGIQTSLWVTNTVTATNFALIKPQWVDILGRSQPSSGVAAPVLTAVTNGSVIQLPGYQQNDISYWTFQLPHNLAQTNSTFVLGTNANTTWHILPHVHFLLNGNAVVDATHTNVTWQMEWQVASINQVFAQGTNSVTRGCTATNVHYLASMPAITNNGPYGISAGFVCRLIRVASASEDLSPNPSTRDVCLIDVDLHVPVANVTAFGSRDETAQ